MPFYCQALGAASALFVSGEQFGDWQGVEEEEDAEEEGEEGEEEEDADVDGGSGNDARAHTAATS